MNREQWSIAETDKFVASFGNPQRLQGSLRYVCSDGPPANRSELGTPKGDGDYQLLPIEKWLQRTALSIFVEDLMWIFIVICMMMILMCGTSKTAPGTEKQKTGSFANWRANDDVVR